MFHSSISNAQQKQQNDELERLSDQNSNPNLSDAQKQQQEEDGKYKSKDENTKNNVIMDGMNHDMKEEDVEDPSLFYENQYSIGENENDNDDTKKRRSRLADYDEYVYYSDDDESGLMVYNHTSHNNISNGHGKDNTNNNTNTNNNNNTDKNVMGIYTISSQESADSTHKDSLLIADTVSLNYDIGLANESKVCCPLCHRSKLFQCLFNNKCCTCCCCCFCCNNDGNNKSNEEEDGLQDKPSNEELLSLAFMTFLAFTICQAIAAVIAKSHSMIGDSAAMTIDAFTYGFNLVAERKKGDIDQELRLIQQGIMYYNDDIEKEKNGATVTMAIPNKQQEKLQMQKQRQQQERKLRKNKLYLELIPPLVSVTVLSTFTIIIFKQAINTLILDSHRDVMDQDVPNIKLMFTFSVLNLFVDVVNVCFFASADHAFGYQTKEDRLEDIHQLCDEGKGMEMVTMTKNRKQHKQRQQQKHQHNNNGNHHHESKLPLPPLPKSSPESETTTLIYGTSGNCNDNDNNTMHNDYYRDHDNDHETHESQQPPIDKKNLNMVRMKLKVHENKDENNYVFVIMCVYIFFYFSEYKNRNSFHSFLLCVLFIFKFQSFSVLHIHMYLLIQFEV